MDAFLVGDNDRRSVLEHRFGYLRVFARREFDIDVIVTGPPARHQDAVSAVEPKEYRLKTNFFRESFDLDIRQR